MASQTGSNPGSVLSKDSKRTTGDEARSMNLSAAKSVGETIRTTLGPRGMDKMLVDSGGNVVVTNDGVTLLEEMDIKHPAAKLIADVASTQEAEVGDGTTSAVVFGGELLAVAEDLLARGVHPSSIVAGYREASKIARDALDDVVVTVDADDVELLERIAATAMTGKGADTEKEHLASIVVEAVRTAVRDDGEVDRDAIDVRAFHGGSVAHSRFIPGTLVDKDPAHYDMPRSLSDASVLVYEGDLELSELGVDAGATVSDFDELSAFQDREKSELADAVDRIVDAGADVVLAEGGIDDIAQQRLVEAGILGLRRVDDEDRRRVAAATGAAHVGSLESLSADDLGHAGRVEQEKIRNFGFTNNAPPERTYVFDDVPGGATGTVLLRGGTEHVLDEVERAVEDSVGVVTAAVEDGEILPGGGAPEIELALAVRDAADSVEGREQLAVEAFADALEVGPRTLAENAGHDTIDALVDLTASHAAGNGTMGLDADSGEPTDALEAGIVEPRRIKETAIESATDAATMILRIDSVISAGDLDGDD